MSCIIGIYGGTFIATGSYKIYDRGALLWKYKIIFAVQVFDILVCHRNSSYLYAQNMLLHIIAKYINTLCFYFYPPAMLQYCKI